MGAGLWVMFLIFYRQLDKPNGRHEGLIQTSIGVDWGIFIAFLLGALLAYAGYRMRAAHVPEPVVDDAPPPAAETVPAPAAADPPPEAADAEGPGHRGHRRGPPPAPAARRRRPRRPAVLRRAGRVPPAPAPRVARPQFQASSERRSQYSSAGSASGASSSSARASHVDVERRQVAAQGVDRRGAAEDDVDPRLGEDGRERQRVGRRPALARGGGQPAVGVAARGEAPVGQGLLDDHAQAGLVRGGQRVGGRALVQVPGRLHGVEAADLERALDRVGLARAGGGEPDADALLAQPRELLAHLGVVEHAALDAWPSGSGRARGARRAARASRRAGGAACAP